MNKQNTIAVLEIMHTKAREIKRKLEADERSFERVKRANLKKIGKYIEHLDKAIDACGEIWEGFFLRRTENMKKHDTIVKNHTGPDQDQVANADKFGEVRGADDNGDSLESDGENVVDTYKPRNRRQRAADARIAELKEILRLSMKHH